MRERFDIFLSYAHVDAEAVDRLVAALETHGLAVYLDREENIDFSSISGSIERGLARSKALLAYYSVSYPTRRACQWELTAAFLAAQREGNPRPRVLVVNPEESADHLEPVELRDALFRRAPAAGDDRALAALAESVAAHVAELEGVLEEVQPVVAPRWHAEQHVGSSRFVGRLAEMWAIHSALQANEVGLITGVTSAVAQVRGLGGIGKSLLAEEYALRFGAAYPGGVFWLRAYGDGEGSLNAGQREAERERQLERFAERVGLQVADRVPEQVEGDLSRWLGAQGQPSLWVIDDLPSGLDGELNRWLAPHPSAKTLITTRSREYDALGGRTDVGELPEVEALELLTKRRQPQGELEWAAAKAITAELGCHALALDVAAATLRYQPFTSFLAALREPGEDWLERLTAELRDALPNGHERSIVRTLSRSIDRLDNEGLDFLRLASVLAVAPVSAQLVISVFMKVDGLKELEGAERQVKALNQVESLSLAEDAGELEWRVHGLVSRTVRFTDTDRQRREALREAAIIVLAAELSAIVDAGAHPRFEGTVLHARELTQRAGDAGELDLLGWVARYDHQRGDYRSAVALWQRHVERCQRVLGEEHPTTIAALNNLAAALHGHGELGDARQRHEEALDLSRRVLGEGHPMTLTSLTNLASVLQAQGDLACARRLQEEAVELARRVLAEEDLETLACLGNLAGTLEMQGHLADARTLHEQALAGRRRVLGDEHADTLSSIDNLAGILKLQGDLGDARRLHKEVLERRRSVLGEQHPHTLASLSNLARVLHERGELACAATLEKQALEGRQRVLGGDHPDTLLSLNNLAETLRMQGDFSRARTLHERALKAHRRVLGHEHPSTITSLNNLAGTLYGLGDLAGALELYESALELSQRVLGDKHPNTVITRKNLAVCKAATRRKPLQRFVARLVKHR